MIALRMWIFIEFSSLYLKIWEGCHTEYYEMKKTWAVRKPLNVWPEKHLEIILPIVIRTIFGMQTNWKNPGKHWIVLCCAQMRMWSMEMMCSSIRGIWAFQTAFQSVSDQEKRGRHCWLRIIFGVALWWYGQTLPSSLCRFWRVCTMTSI